MYSMITNDDIITCENELLQAMKDCNLTSLNDILHDDLLFNGPDGETITKTMDIAAYQSGNMIVNDLKASNQQISILGDNAIVAVTVELKGEFMRQSIGGIFRYIRVWKKVDNRLKVIGGGCTPIYK